MVKKIIPPKTAGGGGFNFEDKVCAFYLAHMLADIPAFDTNLGIPQRIDFQTRADGWYLDDILLILHDDGGEHRVAISIKSNEQFTKSGAPNDFVKTCWEQYLHEGSKCFDKEMDLLALATAPLPIDIRKAVDNVINKAKAMEPGAERLKKGMESDGWANPLEKTIFKSFAPPTKLKDKYKVEASEITKLLSSLRFPEFDFDTPNSKNEKEGVGLCRKVLVGGKFDEAQILWEKLISISSQNRPLAGTITRQKLIGIISPQFKLKNKPEHNRDWERLLQDSRRSMSVINDKIGEKIKFKRVDAIELLNESLRKNRVVVFHGHPGIGKSAVAKECITDKIEEGEKVLWIDAVNIERESSLNAFVANLQLENPLQDILDGISSQICYLVLDGLDRIYASQGFKILATLLSMCRIEKENSLWRILIISRSEEIGRILEGLRVNNCWLRKWESTECPKINTEELAPVWEDYQKLKKLQYNQKLLPILSNLKLLDLIVNQSENVTGFDPDKWVGETSIANWFFESVIKNVENGAARIRFVEKLAELQAEKLVGSLPIREFDSSELELLDSLKKDRLCRVTQYDHIVFDHDLYGDWVRLRILITHSSNLEEYLENRYLQPLWHRAVRLYGEYLLESQSSISEFKKTIDNLSAGQEIVVKDLLFESPIYAANPLALLNQLKQELFNNNGKILKRILSRFRMYATLPDPWAPIISKTNNELDTSVKARFRVPNWIYWPALLQFLYDNKDEIIPYAAVEIAKIVELWLTKTETGFTLRRECAEVGLLLAENCYNARNDYGNLYNNDKRLFYSVGLLGAEENPTAIANFALRASERLEIEEESKPIKIDGEDFRKNSKYEQIMSATTTIISEPWPHGPKRKVDEDFRNAVLDNMGNVIVPLFKANPDAAIEVAQAVLTKPPGRRMTGPLEEVKLEIEWLLGQSTVTYVDGPFLQFLHLNFKKGLKLILGLIDFATERIMDLHKEEYKHIRPLSIMIDGSEKKFFGDINVYGWASGTGYTAPPAVYAALMALEKYLYQQIEKDMDISDKIRKILAESNSTALNALLINVGKKHPSLFIKPLKELLEIPEFYYWDLSSVIGGNLNLAIGLFMRGQFIHDLAMEFLNMEHRNTYFRGHIFNLYFNEPDVQEFIDKCRKKWKERLKVHPEDPYREIIESLITMLDSQNYELVEKPEGILLINKQEVKNQELRTDEIKEVEFKHLINYYTVKCRQILDQKDEFDLGNLESFWDELQNFSKKFEEYDIGDDLIIKIEDVISGGIAVIVRNSFDWLKKYPDKLKWCINQMENIITNPPLGSTHDIPESISTWTWDCFAAESLPILWVDDLENKNFRNLITKLVWAPHYAAVEILFNRLAEVRDLLKSNFTQVRGLLFERAYLDNRMMQVINRSSYDKEITEQVIEQVKEKIDKHRDKHSDAFVKRSLPTELDNWDEYIIQDMESEFLALIHPNFHKYVFNVSLIRSAHKWIPTLDKSNDEYERQDWIIFWKQALEYILKWVEEQPDENNSKRTHIPIPNDFERWVLAGVAETIQYMPKQEKPDLLWKKILDLPREAHNWYHDFIDAYHRHGLESKKLPIFYSEYLKDIIMYYLSGIPEGERATKYYLSRDLVHLCGIYWLTRDYWKEEHKLVVESLLPVYEHIFQVILAEEDLIIAFSRWLCNSAAEPILLKGMSWIDTVIQDETNRPFLLKNSQTRDAIASMLAVAWAIHENEIRIDQEILDSFQRLLNVLSERHQETALYLQGQIGGLF